MKKEIKEKKVNTVEVKITPEIRALFDGYHKETEQERKRHVGALSEDFQHGLSAVAEQYSGLNEKIEDIKETLDEHGRILKMHTEMIGGIAEDVAVLKDDVAEIKDELKTKADTTEVIHLSRRVSVLEQHV